MRDVLAPADEGLDVLRLLAEHADVEAGYGGRFVNGIDGLASTFGAAGSDDAADWFYWVDGEMADVGADERKLKGGETVWWDYHPWADAMYVPQALHAFPRPYAGAPAGVDRRRRSHRACRLGQGIRHRTGRAPGARRRAASRRHRGRDRRRGGRDAVARRAARARTQRTRDGARRRRHLTLLAPDGSAGPRAAAAALPAPNQDDPSRPFLILLGASGADLEDLLSRLSADALNARVGVALVDDRLVALPWTKG